MTTAIRKTPALLAGVCPVERAKDLRTVGISVSTRMDSISEGDTLFRPDGAFVVVRTQHDLRRTGSRVTLRDLEGTTLRTIAYDPSCWVSRLELLPVTAVSIHPGDIVLYGANGAPEQSVAAIRHNHGWARTAAPWALYSDGEVSLHIREGKARVIRDTLLGGAEPRRRMPLGSVVACQDVKALEPTVWVRTGPDYWVSSSRGVSASDTMIHYELERGTYHVVWIPEPRGIQ